jgi:hypothetical protein
MAKQGFVFFNYKTSQVVDARGFPRQVRAGELDRLKKAGIPSF